MEIIQVREYANLVKVKSESSSNNSLDEAEISEETYNFLAKMIEENRLKGAIFRDYIRLDSQVGYIETPHNVGIEILPKISNRLSDESITELQKILQKMVRVVLNVSSKEIHNAHLQRSNLPLHEWIYQQFLDELKVLFRHGLKRDYERVARTEKFMRGQLDINKVMRAKAGQAHVFPIRYDEFNFNRLENRLIKTALAYLFKNTKDSENWRVANELMQRLSSLELVQKGHLQLKHWQDNKLMQGYRGIFPWCKLILEKMNPDFQQGKSEGIAMLFPMEDLFESYVGHYLNNYLHQWNVSSQDQKYALVQHNGSDMFRLKPDFVLKAKNMSGDHHQMIIADTKWKSIVQDKSLHNYGINQADIYQMLGYGYKYQQNNEYCTDMLLIYPYHDQFTETLSVFEFHSENLKLHVVPFKLWECDQGKEGHKLAEFITDYELKYSKLSLG